MRPVLFFAMLCCCAVTRAGDERTAIAPGAVAPQFFQISTVAEEAITFVQIQKSGAEIKKVVRIKDIAVHDTDGNALPAELWKKLAVKGAVVVLSADSRPVDPAYARILKTDTLLITIKEPAGVGLYRPEMGIGNDTGKLILRWGKATGLRARSVSLSYAQDINGPWHVIAEKLENQGSYAWKPPADFPAGFFLRLEATGEDGTPLQAQTEALHFKIEREGKD
jgi:hypothetical protein